MKKTDLAYVAGIIDGEGWIGIYTANKIYRLNVGVSNTNEWLVRWLEFAFGGHMHVLPVRHPNAKLQYDWQMCGRKAAEFLTLIYPYLRIKRYQAEIALDYQKAKRHYGHMSDKESAIAEAQRILMASLNKRGKIVK